MKESKRRRLLDLNDFKSGQSYILRWLNPDGWIPFSRRKHCHRIQELIQAGQKMVSLLGFVGDVMEDLVRHDCSHSTPNLVVGLKVALGSQHHKEEPGRNRNFRQITEDHGLLQSDEGRQRLLQKLDLANQDVGGLRTLRDLLHEVAVHLRVGRINRVTTGRNNLIRIVPGQILTRV